MVDAELEHVDRVLRERRGFALTASGVAGVESERAMRKYLPTTDWVPIDVRIRITDVVGVVRKFGGKALYGANTLVPLRELVANAADAVRARRELEQRPKDWGRIDIRLIETPEGHSLEVEDTGIGMSEELLTGPLLDFGTTYWSTSLARVEHPGLLSGGFRPTGRFGIGFFSVFDIGSSLSVVSRPYRSGRENTRALEFPADSGMQPYLTQVSDDVLQDGGTRVRVHLNQAPFSEGGLLGLPEDGVDRATYFASKIAQLAPTLDVSVYCVLDGQPEIRAVGASDWSAIPFDQLLRRLPSERYSWPTKKAFEGSIIRSGGECIGRVRLSLHPHGIARGTMTVGGLASFRSIQRFDGIVLASNPTLSRNEAISVVTEREWQKFVLSCMKKAHVDALEPEESIWLAQLLLGFGARPKKVPCFGTSDGNLDAEELRSRFLEVEPGASVRIVLDESIEFEVLGDTVSVDLVNAGDEWEVPADVVLVGEGREREWRREYGSMIADGIPRLPDRALSFSTVTGSKVPASLAVYAVEIAAKAWGVPPEQLLEQAYVFRGSLGEIDIRGESEDVQVDILSIDRPDET